MPKASPRNFQQVRKPQNFQEVIRLAKGIDRSQGWELYHDFEGASGTTLPSWLGSQETGTDSTVAYVDDATGGEFRLLHGGTSEAQNMTIYGGDQLMLDVTKQPFFEARVKLNTVGAAFTADQRIVIGLASARNAVLNDIVTHAWFKVEGPNFDLLLEADDGTTDTDDQDSTLNWSDNSYAVFRVSIVNDTTPVAVYEVDLEDGAGFVVAGAIAIAAATGNLQPYVEMQRDAGAELEDARIDHIRVGAGR